MDSIAYGVADVLNFAANLFCIHISVLWVELAPEFYSFVAKLKLKRSKLIISWMNCLHVACQ